MRDDNCIFCKLANGDIPTNTIYEDESYRAILDMSPATKGHALIIPKSHYRNIYDLPESKAGEVFTLAKRLVDKMKERLGADGFNIVQNNEETAGQTVFHFHMHLIPRYKNDGQCINWKPSESNAQELKEIVDLMA